MIINLYSTKIDGDIIHFDLPMVYFKMGQSVCVVDFLIKWKNKTNNVCGTISSTLIDKNPLNPHQIIHTFSNGKKDQIFAHCPPTHLQEYKIQCLALDSSVFKINLTDSHQKNIKQIFLQLKINDRIFKSGQRPL